MSRRFQIEFEHGLASEFFADNLHREELEKFYDWALEIDYLERIQNWLDLGYIKEIFPHAACSCSVVEECIAQDCEACCTCHTPFLWLDTSDDARVRMTVERDALQGKILRMQRKVEDLTNRIEEESID